MAIVVFDPAAFKLAYPEWAAVADARLVALFNMAQFTMLDNTDNSPVMDVNFRTQLFYMLVAHLLVLYGGAPVAGGSGTNTPPGRVASATEGTVSTSFEYSVPQGSAMAAWYLQTKYGAMYWTATARFRSAKYMVLGDSGTGYARDFRASPVNVPGGV